MSTDTLEEAEEVSKSRGAGADAKAGVRVGVEGSEWVLLKSGRGGIADVGSVGGTEGEEALVVFDSEMSSISYSSSCSSSPESSSSQSSSATEVAQSSSSSRVPLRGAANRDCFVTVSGEVACFAFEEEVGASVDLFDPFRPSSCVPTVDGQSRWSLQGKNRRLNLRE
jgi:hypothetical protein